MGTWYEWAIIAGIFSGIAFVNFMDGKDPTINIVEVAAFAILSVSKYFCDKNEKNGKKIFKYVGIGVALMFVIAFVLLVIKAMK